MARVRSIVSQVSNIIKQHNGVGISKKEQRESSGIQSENNQNVSDLIHSYKSLTDTRNNLKNLGYFTKEKYQIKDMSKIDISIVKDWIKSKNLVYRSASNYLSELNKVSDHFSFNRNEIKELRAELRETLNITGNLAQQTRSYIDLDKLELKNEALNIAFELQRDYGLRVKEATHINLVRQIRGNILAVQGKGGKLIEKELNPTLISKIKENAKNGIYSVNMRTYSRNLEKAITKTGQKWNGTHGIRHSYAQSQLEAGKSKLEVSQEMGHNREEITDTYLR
jgi:integrase